MCIFADKTTTAIAAGNDVQHHNLTRYAADQCAHPKSKKKQTETRADKQKLPELYLKFSTAALMNINSPGT